MKITIAKSARQDLEQIWEACAHSSGVHVADSLNDRIGATLARTIGVFPGSGRLRPELGPALRSCIVLPYVVIYRIKRGRAEVVRILHGHRDIKPPLISLLLSA
jgi:toxin ParE1/3/4